MKSTALVIPCYNEANRLNASVFLNFLSKNPGVHYLFVNDGSTDDTQRVLDELCATSERAEVLHLDSNSGKAEAVRQGMKKCFEQSFEYVAYWDADLSTPLEELPRFLSLMDEKPQINIVTGARVKLIGREVERKASRHYFGRMFATAVSVLLGIDLYDTQCGAKLFRVMPVVSKVFDEPFHTRWIFDVEIFARYKQERDLWAELIELPLLQWRDVDGSKVRIQDFFKAPLELFRIRRMYKN